MSDAAHGIPGQTSEFEYKLVKAFTEITFPCSGKYLGWFHLLINGKIVKVDENNLMLKFTRSTEDLDSYSVIGDGSNKFGKFTVKGTFNLSDAKAHLYSTVLL